MSVNTSKMSVKLPAEFAQQSKEFVETAKKARPDAADQAVEKNLISMSKCPSHTVNAR